MPSRSKAVYKLTVIAMSVALITLSSWISIPFFVGLTLQIFSVFLISSCFGPEISLSSVILYVSLGLIGVPVFSGFNAGLSVLLGVSGGYLIGFMLSAVFLSISRRYYTENKLMHFCFMLIALFICYICGSIWYIFVYQPASPLISALTLCILPFVIPDLIKLLLVSITFSKLYPYIKKLSI